MKEIKNTKRKLIKRIKKYYDLMMNYDRNYRNDWVSCKNELEMFELGIKLENERVLKIVYDFLYDNNAVIIEGSFNELKEKLEIKNDNTK